MNGQGVIKRLERNKKATTAQKGMVCVCVTNLVPSIPFSLKY